MKPTFEKKSRKICQVCHKNPAERHCQSCRRFHCEGCRHVGGNFDPEDFLQMVLVRCKHCGDDEVRLPPMDLEIEG